MNAMLPAPAETPTGTSHRYVVSHGKGGALGIFAAASPMPLRRGQLVVLHTLRGIEIGSVLCAATDRQALLLGPTSAGPLLRRVTAEDRTQRERQATLEQQIFETSRAWATQDGLALEILDVDLLFDASRAIVQFVGAETETEAFAQKLEAHFGLAIRLENLATPTPREEESHGCDKPDCGRTADGGGGCTTCSTGGGCSSCGSSKVDLRQYFGHLRTKMEEKQRIPLA